MQRININRPLVGFLYIVRGFHVHRLQQDAFQRGKNDLHAINKCGMSFPLNLVFFLFSKDLLAHYTCPYVNVPACVAFAEML
jgi:hypothetical protein